MPSVFKKVIKVPLAACLHIVKASSPPEVVLKNAQSDADVIFNNSLELFGPEPINYQKILKEYLISNLKNYKTAKVEFINAPSKISIDHLGDNYTGYRVCLSINERRGDYFIGYRNHFFLIRID